MLQELVTFVTKYGHQLQEYALILSGKEKISPILERVTTITYRFQTKDRAFLEIDLLH